MLLDLDLRSLKVSGAEDPSCLVSVAPIHHELQLVWRLLPLIEVAAE
jgi:hypothetical protein